MPIVGHYDHWKWGLFLEVHFLLGFGHVSSYSWCFLHFFSAPKSPSRDSKDRKANLGLFSLALRAENFEWKTENIRTVCKVNRGLYTSLDVPIIMPDKSRVKNTNHKNGKESNWKAEKVIEIVRKVLNIPRNGGKHSAFNYIDTHYNKH